MEITIGFIGNPNCGKTTLFNDYTGANLKVANYPGVTVEKVEGQIIKEGTKIHLVDLPGAYSLTSYTMEERVTRSFILSDECDVVINVVDASTLERSLYLTLQLLELGKPVVMALNMMDIVKKRGMEIDLHRLPEMLGIPVIPVSARKREGLDILLHAAIHHKGQNKPDRLIHEHDYISKHPHKHHDEYAMVYSDQIEDKIDEIINELRLKYGSQQNERFIALKILESDGEILEKYPELSKHAPLQDEIINEKYAFIEEIIKEVLLYKEKQDALTQKVDRILTHKVFGFLFFLVVMALVFFLTFSIGDYIKSYFELAFGLLGEFVTHLFNVLKVNEALRSLVVDGIIGGVGTVITFLPNITILFLALAFLEDSGYMARVAYIMEGIMSKLGLSGRAFIPMLLGFGCTVPAIMASRTLENKKDRLRVMLVTPFMSCNARLTIYILFSEMFFASHAMIVAYSMYVIGLLVAIIASWLIHLFDRHKNETYLIIELPEYKMPDLNTVAIYVWDKVKDYVEKAGTTIFVATIIIWLLLNVGPNGFGDMQNSFGALLAQKITFIFVPIGLGFWQIVVALIAGISAKEVVVSSCAVLFGVASASSAQGMAALLSSLNAIGFGSLNAFCLMVFSLLYIPCVATLVMIYRESQSLKWTLLEGFFQLAVAYIVTFLVYQIGLLII